jgi:predicted phage terminase large subunit-like protein
MDYEEAYAQKQAYKKLYENMALFGVHCFPTALNKDIPPFHGEVYKALANDRQKKVAIAAPRGTAKSTTTSLIFPLWRVAFKKSDEDLFIVIVSESQQQAINFLSRIKHHLTNSHKFKALFGDMSGNTAKRWTNNDIVLANGTRIIAVGTGQRVRGFIEGDTRPNLIIVDDFESELNAYTAEARTKNRKWITEAVMPSLSDEGKIVMIGTVISEDCFLYWVKEAKSWQVLWYSIWDEDEVPLWEAKFPRERILEIKNDMSSVGNINGFYQEYMNIAQSPDSAPFKPEWMKMHHNDFEMIDGQTCMTRTVGEERTIIPVEVYMGVDPASSLAAHADFFVIAAIGMDYEGNRYAVDIFRERLSPEKQPAKIVEMYKKYKPRRVKIETVGYQEALRTAVREIQKEEGIYIPGIEKGVKPRNRKSERLLSMVPMFAKGQFYWRPQDLTGQQEFLSYPKGKHDDVMDAIWTALDGAKPCRLENWSETDNKRTIVKKVIDWMVL